MSAMIELCLEIIRETEKAFLVTDDDGDTQAWIPKSQIRCEDLAGPGDMIIFDVPEWLASEKGFI